MSWDGGERFIAKARAIHGSKFSYDKVVYINCKLDVVITCPDHGDFEQSPASHINQAAGCGRCGYARNGNARRHTTDQFIQQARAIHGQRYSYAKVVYVDSKTKVVITCPDHGDFEQVPYSHTSGCGCKECQNITIGDALRSTTAEFVAKARQAHRNKYSYNKTSYGKGAKNPVVITCPYHGDFIQTPDDHLSGSGCPTCGESQGERDVARTLQQLNVEFDREFSLPDCRYKAPLKFDFCVWGKDGFPKFLEYQGIQHYEATRGWNTISHVRAVQQHDAIKAAFCERLNIPLLTIPYWDAGNIPELVTEFITAR